MPKISEDPRVEAAAEAAKQQARAEIAAREKVAQQAAAERRAQAESEAEALRRELAGVEGSIAYLQKQIDDRLRRFAHPFCGSRFANPAFIEIAGFQAQIAMMPQRVAIIEARIRAIEGEGA